MHALIATIFVLMLLSQPGSVLAGETALAGFPQSSFWVSKNNTVAGETVRFYATVHNANNATFNGTLVFLVDNIHIAEKEFSLRPETSTLESALWSATPGTHTAGAIIENALGISIASVTQESDVVAFAVTKPPSSPIAESASRVVNTVSDIASASVPAVVSVLKTVHEIIEPYRENVVTYLEQMQKQQEVNRSSAKNTEPENPTALAADAVADFVPEEENNGYATKMRGAWSAFSQAALAGLLFTTKTPALFYALLLAVLVGTLYSLFRWALRRPF